jgi:hypothetical protein
MVDLARAAYLVHRAQCGLIHAATPLHKVTEALRLAPTARVRAEVTADLRTAARHAPVRRMADRPAAVIRRVAQATAHRVEVRLMVVEDTPAIAHRLHPTPRRRVVEVAVMEAEVVVVTTEVAVGAAPTVAAEVVAEAVRTVEVAGATPAEDIANSYINYRGARAV